MVDLWIRSQCGKHLLKCNNIVIAQTTHNEAQVMGYVDPELSYVKLGIYKTEERAMEVLNEIQRELHSTVMNFGRLGYPFIVYNMPQE